MSAGELGRIRPGDDLLAEDNHRVVFRVIPEVAGIALGRGYPSAGVADVHIKLPAIRILGLGVGHVINDHLPDVLHFCRECFHISQLNPSGCPYQMTKLLLSKLLASLLNAVRTPLSLLRLGSCAVGSSRGLPQPFFSEPGLVVGARLIAHQMLQLQAEVALSRLWHSQGAQQHCAKDDHSSSGSSQIIALC